MAARRETKNRGALAFSGNFLTLGGVGLDMSKVLISLALVASLGYCSNFIAQQPAPALPAYDVVVIKLNNSLSRHMSVDMDEDTRRSEEVWYEGGGVMSVGGIDLAELGTHKHFFPAELEPEREEEESEND